MPRDWRPTTSTLAGQPRRRERPLLAADETVLRLAVAGLTVTMATVHLVLWLDGIRHAPTVGPLFLMTAVVGYVLAVAVLVAPGWILAAAAALTGILNAGALVGLYLAIHGGLFGFHSSLQAPHATLAVGAESAALVGATGLCLLALRRSSGVGLLGPLAHWSRRGRAPVR